jgi:hypothetical protein
MLTGWHLRESIMKRIFLVAVCLSVWTPIVYAIEIAPLRHEYVTGELNLFEKKFIYRFTKTDLTEDGFSVICNMGFAIPDDEKEGWYSDKPIAGFQLELRARAIINRFPGTEGDFVNAGYVVLARNGEIVKSLDPTKRSFLLTWSNSGPAIYVAHGSLDGAIGSLSFDLLSGNGFYYKDESEKPDYFLSECRKIVKPNLPLYERHRENGS